MTEHDELMGHVELREDVLLPTKRLVQSGRVRIHRRVVQERRTIQVPVTREDLILERVAPEQWTPAEREAEFPEGRGCRIDSASVRFASRREHPCATT